MLRRFNSLIKGPKGQLSDDDLNSELVVSLRPALSVDSSLFSSSSHVNPLQQQLARLAREDALTARHGGSHTPENGQTSLNNAASHEPVAHGFPISRVPEEKSWKEGYEHKIVINNPLEASRVPRPSSEASRVPRPSSEAARVPRPSNEAGRVSRTSSGAAGILRASSEAAGVLRTSSTAAGISRTSSEAARVLRTSSDGAAANQLMTARSTDSHFVVDIPDAHPGSSIDLEALRKSSAFNVGPGRTISSWSTDSAAEHCRICQTHTEEPLIDLGCACRGEMAKSHRSCIETWFKNKGTNRCEVCQHEAKNIPAPPSSPVPHFWVWRLGGPYGAAAAAQLAQQQSATSSRDRMNPLWVALAILTAGLMFDVLISIFLGASALPVNIIIGVLVVLGLGTAVRLVLEYMHEKNMRRRIALLELDPVPEDPAEGTDSSSDHAATPTPPQNGPFVASAV